MSSYLAGVHVCRAFTQARENPSAQGACRLDRALDTHSVADLGTPRASHPTPLGLDHRTRPPSTFSAGFPQGRYHDSSTGPRGQPDERFTTTSSNSTLSVQRQGQSYYRYVAFQVSGPDEN